VYRGSVYGRIDGAINGAVGRANSAMDAHQAAFRAAHPTAAKIADGIVLAASVTPELGGFGKPSVSAGAVVDALEESGAKVTPHATSAGGEGVAINFGDGTTADVRVETHPLTVALR